MNDDATGHAARRARELSREAKSETAEQVEGDAATETATDAAVNAATETATDAAANAATETATETTEALSDADSDARVSILSRVRFVLVGTTHPGNIGGVARAMKTMALSQLVLVEPRHFPDPLATAMATGAADLLDNARVTDTLADAIGDCRLVIGTSARQRHVRWPLVTPREAADEACQVATNANGEVAIVFGRESSGLSNAELDLCHRLLHIPCAPLFRSLNLASATQVVAYELYRSADELGASRERLRKEPLGEDTPASARELEYFYAHLEDALRAGDFFSGKNAEPIMRRFRSLFGRATMSRREVGLLRGLLSLLERKP